MATTETGSGIERLRRERDEFTAAKRDDGKTAGREWALNEAPFETLQMITTAFPKGYGEVSVHDFVEAADADGEQVFGDDWQDLSNAYVGGFVAGVIEVFEQI